MVARCLTSASTSGYFTYVEVRPVGRRYESNSSLFFIENGDSFDDTKSSFGRIGWRDYFCLKRHLSNERSEAVLGIQHHTRIKELEVLLLGQLHDSKQEFFFRFAFRSASCNIPIQVQ